MAQCPPPLPNTFRVNETHYVGSGGGAIWCNNKTTTMVDALVFRPGPLYTRVADPAEVDPDPDPTFLKKNRVWIPRNDWIQTRPLKKTALVRIRPNLDQIKVIHNVVFFNIKVKIIFKNCIIGIDQDMMANPGEGDPDQDHNPDLSLKKSRVFFRPNFDVIKVTFFYLFCKFSWYIR